MNKKLTLALAALSLSAATASAQTIKVAKDYDVQITGSLQTDFLVPQEDNKIGTGTYDDKVLNNTYAEVHALSKYVDAGVRLEYLDHPLPGFDKDFKGWGVPFYYIKGKMKNAELTLGNFYEQFGSGFILRTYEERSLGIDNSLLGGRVMVRPFKGVQAKAVVGTQRRYWDTQSLIAGADLELSVSEWSQKMQQSGTNLTLGASWVVNHQHQKEDISDATHKLRFVENTNAFDVRANLQKGNYFGTMLVKMGVADALLGGATYSTADTVRPALQLIKTKKGAHLVSSCFIMVRGDEMLAMGDCAINIDYQDTVDKATGEVTFTAAQKLAEVAVESARTAEFFGIDPKVALLSFSTKGSGKGGTVQLSHDATIEAQKLAPEMAIDGEMQFDAAVSPVVGQLKFPGSKVAGYANTFIFPCIEAGNIGYKIAQRLGNFDAYGPILQGLNAPINDLSRGCNADEVYKMAIITAALA